jgi:hypothetical protein
VLSRHSASFSWPERDGADGKFYPERHSSDLLRRSGSGSRSAQSEIFVFGDTRATIAPSRDAREKKNEAEIRFLLTDRDDFDK